jgi:hypothetical protein
MDVVVPAVKFHQPGFEVLAYVGKDGLHRLKVLLREYVAPISDHEARVEQAFGGHIDGARKDAYARSLRRSGQLTMDYREILCRHEPGEPQ